MTMMRSRPATSDVLDAHCTEKQPARKDGSRCLILHTTCFVCGIYFMGFIFPRDLESINPRCSVGVSKLPLPPFYNFIYPLSLSPQKASCPSSEAGCFLRKSRDAQAEAKSSSIVVSVKEIANFYGEKLLRENSAKHKGKYDVDKFLPTRIKDLHMARNNIRRLADSRKQTESIKNTADAELSDARKTVKDLSLQIEESNKRAKSQRKEIHRLRKAGISGYEWPLTAGGSDTNYMEVVKELELMKKELHKLKIEMASLLESKLQEERQISSFVLRTRSHSSSIEAMRKDVEKAAEEEVLVELAKMEAARELQAIEAERKAKAVQFASTMEETQQRTKVLREELHQTKDLEKKLEITNSDINVLENELMLVRAMSQRTTQPHSPESLKQMNDLAEKVENMEEKSALNDQLETAVSELNEAKKELHAIREEGFKFMASMDVIIEELKHVSEKAAQLKKVEIRSDSTVQKLNSKLLRAKSKLEAANLADEKARSILSNLTTALRQMESDKETITKEKDDMVEEMLSIKQEIQNVECEIEVEEGKLLSRMQELKVLKKSEAMALEFLKAVTEKTVRTRATNSSRNSTITISKFEYDYLTHHAKAAEEIADKKVAAAQAWIEALKTGEREILLKTKIAQREIEDLKAMEDQELYRTNETMSAKRMVKNELNKRLLEEKETVENLQLSLSRKESGDVRTPRRSKNRRASSPSIRHLGRSNTVNLRKNRKVVPNLAKIFGRSKEEKGL